MIPVRETSEVVIIFPDIYDHQLPFQRYSDHFLSSYIIVLLQSYPNHTSITIDITILLPYYYITIMIYMLSNIKYYDMVTILLYGNIITILSPHGSYHIC